MKFGLALPLQGIGVPVEEFLDELRAEVRAADRAGFDAFFLSEFHQAPGGTVLSPLLVGAALAEQTSASGSGRRSWPGRCTIRCASPRT